MKRVRILIGVAVFVASLGSAHAEGCGSGKWVVKDRKLKNTTDTLSNLEHEHQELISKSAMKTCLSAMQAQSVAAFAAVIKNPDVPPAPIGLPSECESIGGVKVYKNNQICGIEQRLFDRTHTYEETHVFERTNCPATGSKKVTELVTTQVCI